jgi:hypothetical protein
MHVGTLVVSAPLRENFLTNLLLRSLRRRARKIALSALDRRNNSMLYLIIANRYQNVRARTNIRRLPVLPKKVIVFRPRGWYDK